MFLVIQGSRKIFGRKIIELVMKYPISHAPISPPCLLGKRINILGSLCGATGSHPWLKSDV